MRMMGTSMRRHRPYRLRSFDFGRIKMVLREEWKLVTLISIFMAGMIIGAISAKHTDNDINARLVTMFSDFAMIRHTQSIFETFCNSFAVYFAFLFVAFASGLCAIGIPIIATIPLIRGIGIGMVSGYLYSTYALSGAGYCIVVLFPGAIISTAAMLLGCNESFVMSRELINLLNGKSLFQHDNILKKYSVRYILLLGFILLASLIDTLMTILFAERFNLF